MSIQWSQEQKALLTLSCTEKIGPILAKALIEHFGSASDVLSASPRELTQVLGVGEKLSRLISSGLAYKAAEEEIKILEQHQGEILPIFLGSEEYPPTLSSCVDAPLVLYARGTLPSHSPMISVVGTRRMTSYTEDILKIFMTRLAQLAPEVTIVSGLAYGVDITAHRLALQSGLKTIGVVAHGHHTLYPMSHRKSAEEICKKGGAILSEYPFYTRPLPSRFVARNRIVAGLSQATLVVESPKKGGALITANMAFDYDRELFAVPGRLFDSNSEGCNYLIARNKASLFTSVDHLLEEIGLCSRNSPTPIPLPFESEELSSKDPLLRLLHKEEEMSAEDIALRLGEDLSKVSAKLFEYELEGIIRALPGGRYQYIKHS